MSLNLQEYLNPTIEVCRKHTVKRLYIFGSAMTDKFHPRSDVDLLAEFDPATTSDVRVARVLLKNDLEEVFKRTVDLVTWEKIQNPHYKEFIEVNKVLIYEKS